jgi:hypothetical protein
MLSERQKQALLEVYESFRAVHAHSVLVSDEEHAAPTDVEAGDPGQATTTEGN